MNPHPSGAWPLHEAILRTVLYADIFDFPLTAAEIHRFLVGCACGVEEVEAALESGRRLAPIEAEPPYYFLAGKGYSARVRRHYLPELERKWRRAAVYGRLLQSVPFVRGGFVTGSLAAGNVDGHSDVDFLLIAQPGRLLLCHAWVKLVFRRGLGGAARVVAGDYFDWMCPNFILGEDALELPRRDLYTAWEATQAVPIFGDAVCRRFLEANAWIGEYLPNSMLEPRRPPVSGWASAAAPARADGGLRLAGRLAETALPRPLAGMLEGGLRAWMLGREAARGETRGGAPGGWPPGAEPSALADGGPERSDGRWQMFPATTRYRILEAYHYRLRCYGLERGQAAPVLSAATAA